MAEHPDDSMRRPFKVWSTDRKTRKSVMVANLAEFITKGKEKLDFDQSISVRAVLERDGTEVDDEEYFQSLESNTVLLVLKERENWSDLSDDTFFSAGMDVADSGMKEQDSGSDDQADCASERDHPHAQVGLIVLGPSVEFRSEGAGVNPNEELLKVAILLRRDIAQLVTLTEEEQRIVADAPRETLQEMLGMSAADTSRIQKACYRYLDEREEAREAKQMLQYLRENSRTERTAEMDTVDGGSNQSKRARSDNS